MGCLKIEKLKNTNVFVFVSALDKKKLNEIIFPPSINIEEEIFDLIKAESVRFGMMNKLNSF